MVMDQYQCKKCGEWFAWEKDYKQHVKGCNG